MADFDEYDYLEKIIEPSGDREKAVEVTKHSSPDAREKSLEEKKRRRSSDDREKEHRRRDRDDDNNVSRRSSDRRSHDREYVSRRSSDRSHVLEYVSRRSSSRRSHDRDYDDDTVSRRRRSDERDSDKEREKERRDKERKRRRSRSPEPESRRANKAAKKEEAEPEADPERDQKTVFAFQLPIKANERDIYDFFSKAGKVRDVRLIMDRYSRKSKGFAYVEFTEVMSVPMAIALSGHPLLGQPVMVKPSEAEKNLVQPSASVNSSQDRKLYVENLHFNFTELQLRQLFEPFGQIEVVQLPTHSETGHCKGYGFVQFVLLEAAQAAKSGLNGMDLGGRAIRVSEYHQESKAFDHIDDEDDLTLNANSRVSLMAKLDRTGAATITMPMVGPAVSVPPLVLATQEPVGNPSQCLLLRNMFDPVGLDDEGLEEIKDDVSCECSKFGAVEHVCVDRDSRGCVYLRFESVEAAVRAQQAMHNRWFACRQISAIFLQSYEYDAKFKGLTASAR